MFRCLEGLKLGNCDFLRRGPIRCRTNFVVGLLAVAIVSLPWVGNADKATSRAVTHDRNTGSRTVMSPRSARVGFSRRNRNGASHFGSCVTLPIPTFKRRNDLAQLLEGEGLVRGAELGVQRGRFSSSMLSIWKHCSEYVLVDIWAPQENYGDVAYVPFAKQEANFVATLKSLEMFSSKIVVCKNFTTVCARKYPDEYFDFIYVDARHDFEGVSIDLQDWWPKLKEGGIFAGHDYIDAKEVYKINKQNWSIAGTGAVDWQGRAVKSAVDHFAHRKGLQVVISYRDSPWNTWAVRKPVCNVGLESHYVGAVASNQASADQRDRSLDI